VPWPPPSGSRCSPSPATSSAEIYVWNALVCLGVGLVLAATPVLTMGDVPPERTAESTVANSTIRYVGSALGTQVAASIVAGQPGSHGYTIAFLVGAAGTGAAVLAALAILYYRHAPPRAALRGRPHLRPAPSTGAGRPDRAVTASAGQVDE